MSNQNTQPDTDAQTTEVTTNTPSPSLSISTKTRRAYQAPAFIRSQAFERQSLSCAGCLNQSDGWPNFCGMVS